MNRRDVFKMLAGFALAPVPVLAAAPEKKDVIITVTGRMEQRPIADCPVIKNIRNKRARTRYIKMLKRHGVTTYSCPVIEWEQTEEFGAWSPA